MEVLKKQKKILTAFCIFLVFMYVCTLISRAVYASKLPQVSVAKPGRMAISHQVEAEGIVHQGREYAVNALSGLRVRTVYAHVGDRVTTESLLFDIDLKDLEEQIREKELAAKKLKLQISDQEKNRALQQEKEEIDHIRAQEDYVRTAEETQNAVDKAERDIQIAQRDLNELKNHPVSVTSDADRKAAQSRYDAWVKERDKLKSEMEQAKADWEAAEADKADGDTTVSSNDAAAADTDGDGEAPETPDSADAEAAKEKYDKAKTAYDEHMKNSVAKPDYSAEDAAKAAWEAEKRSLEDAANAAAWAKSDAGAAQEKALEDAARQLDDAQMTGASDSSLEISRLELSALQSELAAYQEILKAQGQIYPEKDGVVTGIRVTPGERVPDGAALVYADLTSPMQFSVSLTKEQKKYVNQGDIAELTLGNRKGEEYAVDYIAENEANPDVYEARILLEEGLGTIGQSGTFTVDAQSETYQCCIPVAALHEDANHRKFVYIVSERSGILGKELAAEAVYVKVLDQNDSYAAIEEGVIDSETELITNSTEPIEDRTVIRYKE